MSIRARLSEARRAAGKSRRQADRDVKPDHVSVLPGRPGPQVLLIAVEFREDWLRPSGTPTAGVSVPGVEVLDAVAEMVEVATIVTVPIAGTVGVIAAVTVMDGVAVGGSKASPRCASGM